jgi:hypothetical protein
LAARAVTAATRGDTSGAGEVTRPPRVAGPANRTHAMEERRLRARPAAGRRNTLAKQYARPRTDKRRTAVSVLVIVRRTGARPISRTSPAIARDSYVRDVPRATLAYPARAVLSIRSAASVKWPPRRPSTVEPRRSGCRRRPATGAAPAAHWSCRQLAAHLRRSEEVARPRPRSVGAAAPLGCRRARSRCGSGLGIAISAQVAHDPFFLVGGGRGRGIRRRRWRAGEDRH